MKKRKYGKAPKKSKRKMEWCSGRHECIRTTKGKADMEMLHPGK